MAKRISELLDQIKSLESQLGDELKQYQQQARFHWRGKRIEFEERVSQTHRALKKSLLRTLFLDRPQNMITAPIIYGMAIPLVIFDVLVTFYQYSCFPIYGMARVERRPYFNYDRGQLKYLNLIQKINCQYCAYGNGLMSYASEIFARTEQYFCPIKHAEKRLSAHIRYQTFGEFADGENFDQNLKRLREQLVSNDLASNLETTEAPKTEPQFHELK